VFALGRGGGEEVSFDSLIATAQHNATTQRTAHPQHSRLNLLIKASSYLLERGFHVSHANIIEPRAVDEVIPFPRVANTAPVIGLFRREERGGKEEKRGEEKREGRRWRWRCEQRYLFALYFIIKKSLDPCVP
jgi:hypothetical protein